MAANRRRSNHALSEAIGEIAVSIDADTIVDPDAVPRLVRHFAEPSVGAVAGNVKVINRNRWITRWQALEYITSQNLERRAFDVLNCITVVPGAVGAWRTALVRSNGGLTGDTVAEDTDLTLAIRRNGWKILYDETAIGPRRSPETVDALVRQRFRWTFGTLQAVWKHRDTSKRKPRYGTLGSIAIPISSCSRLFFRSFLRSSIFCSCSRWPFGDSGSSGSRACRSCGRRRTSSAR